jgi:hypothetical protein
MTSESSELELFSITIPGYKACSSNNLLVSDLEPVMAIADLSLQDDDFKSRFIGCGSAIQNCEK